MLCELMMDLLVAEGAEVQIATDGRQAIDFLDKFDFNVLLSDVRMSGIDGPKIVESIDQTKKEKMKIYFCSGFNDLSNEDLQKLGVPHIFQKPFEIEDVVVKLLEEVKKSA